MEQFNNTTGEALNADGWEAWDAVPRDGPAVFVVDTKVFDTDSRVRGRWLDPSASAGALREQLRQLLGRDPEPGSWAIIDQVGLGPLMAPETLAIEEMAGIIEETMPEVRR